MMLWFVFAAIVVALLLLAVWVDRNRRRHGITREMGPLSPEGGLYNPHGSAGTLGASGDGGGGS